MAFRFSWPEFDQEFYVEAKSQLETALNKGNKPPVIVDHITVKELNMGTKVKPNFPPFLLLCLKLTISR